MAENIAKRARYGDLFRLGNHLLLCGDSMKKESYERLMGNEVADMCFTDPPYGVSYVSNMRGEKFDTIKNDHTILDFFKFVKEYNKGFFFCFCSVPSLQPMLSAFSNYFKLQNMIVWDKKENSMGDLKSSFGTNYELALVANENKKNLTLKRCGSIWCISRGSVKGYLHPTQKPVALAEFAIRRCTQNRELVLDMFGGSGTTLLACENTGRRCRMIELDEHYCDVIIHRWEALTNQKAELVCQK